MLKRLFWFLVGLAAGLVIASKAQAYVRSHTPRMAREFVLGPDQDNVTLRTLGSLIEDFQQYRTEKETEMNASYAEKFGRR
ncbi:hypothetical protein [Alloscardovia macacae]|uniref:Secreted protein n=1 Tax=Alloscardovia macacae TaxID=1160091 RepID=A0A1Y2T0G1_9BIFI|nr:hypothetical protein [Alloscardovia macacae]OTA26338.1 hypothetical protein B9G54_04960 [Alloscardovia macacae]OTA28404.1 hypothetical protein B9T39_06855 [Alloscardovia macacae]OZG53048.1 hypothetical protein ALMA_1350 [Alloscardovia macacae]